MHKIIMRFAVLAGLFFFSVDSSYALDSYRFMHVSIDTPWTIFLFLLGTIFAPFILMAVLVWRFAERKADTESQPPIQSKDTE